MNHEHRVLCASPEWGEFLREHVLPWVLDGVVLDDNVLEADGSELPLDPGFSAACCFTMLHHVPTRELQERVLSSRGRVPA